MAARWPWARTSSSPSSPGRAATTRMRSSSASASSRTPVHVIHIEKHEIEARDTKLGPEEITRDIPNVGEEACAASTRTGSSTRAPRSSPATSWSADHAEGRDRADRRGAPPARSSARRRARSATRACACRTASADRGRCPAVQPRQRRRAAPGVNRLVRVSVAQKRKIAVGDKMAGRHGNKGVIAKILPRGHAVHTGRNAGRHRAQPARRAEPMNIGQILETHLGWAMKALGLKAATPVFDGATEEHIEGRSSAPACRRTARPSSTTGAPASSSIIA